MKAPPAHAKRAVTYVMPMFEISTATKFVHSMTKRKCKPLMNDHPALDPARIFKGLRTKLQPFCGTHIKTRTL